MTYKVIDKQTFSKKVTIHSKWKTEIKKEYYVFTFYEC